MTEVNQIYKCSVCGNIVEILHSGAGELVCCGQSMKMMNEKTKDEGAEKHVPVIENNNGLIRIKLGEIPHPMEVGHYIEWIEIIANGKTYKKYLTEGDDPEFTFVIDAENVIARAYCNVHGLWKSQL
jgi:superoxide reductase